jgi:hypothetical protein
MTRRTFTYSGSFLQDCWRPLTSPPGVEGAALCGRAFRVAGGGRRRFADPIRRLISAGDLGNRIYPKQGLPPTALRRCQAAQMSLAQVSAGEAELL